MKPIKFHFWVLYLFICQNLLFHEFYWRIKQINTIYRNFVIKNCKLSANIQFEKIILMKHLSEQQKKKPIIPMKTKPHSFYVQKFHKKLQEPNCVIQPLTTLCGGWYIQTFKQVTNKLCKNKSSPIPLFFPNIQSMQAISKNKPLLKIIFNFFDTRQLGRIDACELYCSFLLLSKGSYQTFLKSIVDVFGFENPGRIKRNQFFFFLDSFYRMLPKILLIKGFQKPISQINSRLDYPDINNFLDILYQEDRSDIERNQIYEVLMKTPQLNQFFKYLQKKCTHAAQNSRIQSINKMKFQAQIRNCVSDMVLKVHLNSIKPQKTNVLQN